MNLQNKISELYIVPDEKKSDFPISVFPKEIQSYFNDANDTLDSNIDYMGCAFLWGISTLIGNSCAIKVKNGWVERASIWVACVGSAGVGKTPSIAMSTRPFERINSRLVTSYPRRYKAWQDSNEKENEPKPEQFIVNDVTTEAIVQLHAINLNCVALFSEELDGWVRNMSRYSNGTDMPFWLKTWNGSAVSTNRKSGNSFLQNPFIPILGGVQPSILENFSTEENKGNGFMDRLLLSCPEIKVELYNNNEMNHDAIQYYDDFVEKMHRYLCMNTKKNEDDEIMPNIYSFDVDAKHEWEKIYNEISLMQNSDEENEYMKSMLPKQKSYIPRFALILHVLKHFENPNVKLIERQTILDAWLISQYFIKNAKMVKVTEAEVKKIKFEKAKEANPKEAFRNLFLSGNKINYTKIAEILNVSRRVLYQWKDEFEAKSVRT